MIGATSSVAPPCTANACPLLVTASCTQPRHVLPNTCGVPNPLAEVPVTASSAQEPPPVNCSQTSVATLLPSNPTPTTNARLLEAEADPLVVTVIVLPHLPPL